MASREVSLENMAMTKKSFWHKRPVLVTGGAGFVGFWLATILAERGAEVYVLSNRVAPKFSLNRPASAKIRFVRGSVTSSRAITSILKKGRIRTVFHLAAQAIVSKSHEGPAQALETNVRGTWVVLEAARAYGVEEIVVASSDKAYGSHDKLPYREDAALQGRNPYDCSKSCADLIAQMYAHSYGLPVAILRPANIYGPGDTNWSRLIPDALRCAFTNREFVIRSDGTFKRDYLYVEDVVDGYLRLAEELRRKRLAGQAFNLGAMKPLSVLQVIAELGKAAGDPIKYQITGRGHHEIKDQYLDASKARRVLGWKPTTSHAEGFKKTAQWYKDYLRK